MPVSVAGTCYRTRRMKFLPLRSQAPTPTDYALAALNKPRKQNVMSHAFYAFVQDLFFGGNTSCLHQDRKPQ